MKNLKKIAVLLTFSLLTITSCDNDDDATNNVCDESYVNTPITNAFSSVNGYNDLPETMDLETHQYRIKINANGEICSVGYQNPSTWTGSYIIIIKNETTNEQTSVSYSFSQSELQYVYVEPLVVNSGDIIKVERTIFGHTLLEETIGRVLRKSDFSSVPYPITQGNVEFLSSDFYGAGGPVPNFAQPYIPLGFKVD